MITNKILDRMRAGEKALGLSMTQPSEELVELAGRMGLDFVNFDGQHSPQDPQVIENMCRVADGFGVTPGMRIPDGQESTILNYLDRGIRQITVPNLQTKEQAEEIVRYSFFGPKGIRSSTSLRVAFESGPGGRAELFQAINDNTILCAQLESVTAMENLDDILTVDGLDYFGGGPEDMAISMGMVGQHTHPKVAAVYEEAEAKIRAAGKFWMGDHTESVNAFGAIMGAASEMLGQHGRESKLAF